MLVYLHAFSINKGMIEMITMITQLRYILKLFGDLIPY